MSGYFQRLGKDFDVLFKKRTFSSYKYHRFTDTRGTYTQVHEDSRENLNRLAEDYKEFYNRK